MPPTLTLAATSFTQAQLLDPTTPQIALAGRSNVGKSSLVNALANRKQLAKTSATPGKTRSINYYTIDHEPDATPDAAVKPAAEPVSVSNTSEPLPTPALTASEKKQQAYLVDLPGYGYARCSQSEREKWATLLEFYLRNTPGLKGVALLLDSRLTPQAMDRHMADFTRASGLPLIPVFTKCDKPRAKELQANLLAWQAILGPTTTIIPCSSEKKKGLETLWDVLLEHLNR